MSHFRYRHFIVLLVSSQTAEDHLEWCGLVEAKVRILIGHLERNQHIALAHVNPKCFDTVNNSQNSRSQEEEQTQSITSSPFCSMWFIGLEFERTENLNVDLTESIQNFTQQVHNQAVSEFFVKFLVGLEVFSYFSEFQRCYRMIEI